METLGERLDAQRELSRSRRTAEESAIVEQAMRQVALSGLIEAAVGVGDRAPEFTLPDQLGRPVSTAELRDLGPYAISFYRGGW